MQTTGAGVRVVVLKMIMQRTKMMTAIVSVTVNRYMACAYLAVLVTVVWWWGQVAGADRPMMKGEEEEGRTWKTTRIATSSILTVLWA